MSAVPRVAVIIPCFEEGALVVEAALSVQEDEPVEIVVVDDASSDEPTAQALAELRERGVRIVTHARNSGLVAARMSGIDASTAPYVFNLDADDLAVPGALAAMADLLEDDPGAAVCFGDYAEFGDIEELRVVPRSLDPFRVAYWNEYPVAALFRRAVLEEVGGWAATGRRLDSYADWDLWMSLAERGERGIHLGDGRPSFRYRIHGPRMFDAARREHPALYAELKRRHPRLFAELREHRRRSGLNPVSKLLYPIVYGGRRRYAFEAPLRRRLRPLGAWRHQR